MYYAGKNLIVSIPVSNINIFSVGDVCGIFRNNNYLNSTKFIVVWKEAETTNTTEDSNGNLVGRLYLTFNNIPLLPQSYIINGDSIKKYSNNQSSFILGPFVDFYNNDNDYVSGRSFDEPYYDPDRHDLFEYSNNSEININQNCLPDTIYSPENFDYTSVAFSTRTETPRGHWNGKASRLACVISRQHLILCKHYPLGSDSFNICTSDSKITRIKRTVVEQGSPSYIYSVSGNGVMDPNLYPTWYSTQTGRSIFSDYPELSPSDFYFSDIIIQTFKTPLPDTIVPVSFLVFNEPDDIDYFSEENPSAALINNSWLTVGCMQTTDSFLNSNLISLNAPWNDIPENISYNDMPSVIGIGDSGSLRLQQYNGKTIYGGMASNASFSYGLNISSTGTYISCVEPSFDGSLCSFDDRNTMFSLSMGTAFLNQGKKRALEIIIQDKSWQITTTLLGNPEKNITENDIVYNNLSFVDYIVETTNDVILDETNIIVDDTNNYIPPNIPLPIRKVIKKLQNFIIKMKKEQQLFIKIKDI